MATGKQRYADVKKALRTHLSKDTRKRLRGEYKKLRGKYEPKPYDPNSPLAGKDFTNTVKDIVGGEYDPQERALGQRVTDTPGWYQEYQDKLAAGNRDLNTAYDTAKTDATTRATNMSTSAQTANTELFDKLRADATARGATLDPAIQEQADRARTNRESLANTFAQGVATQGLNARAAGTAREGIAARDRVEALASLAGQQRALKTARGKRTTEVFTTLRDKERQYTLENKAFGLKSSEAASDAAMAAAKLGLDAQRVDNDTDRTNWATDPNNPDNQPKGGTDKPKFPAKEVRDNKTKFRDGRDFIKNNRKSFKTAKEAQLYLTTKKGMKEDMARAAALDAIYGGVDAKTRRAILKHYGVKLKLSPSERKKKK